MCLILGCLIYFILSFYIWLKAYRIVEKGYWAPNPKPTWFSVIFFGCFVCQFPPLNFFLLLIVVIEFLCHLRGPKFLSWLWDAAKLPKIKITWS